MTWNSLLWALIRNVTLCIRGVVVDVVVNIRFGFRVNVVYVGEGKIGLGVGVGIDVLIVASIKNKDLCYVLWEELVIVFTADLPQKCRAAIFTKKKRKENLTFLNWTTYLKNRIDKFIHVHSDIEWSILLLHNLL